MIVATGQGDGDCGIDFKEGLDYLVYVSEWGMYAKHTLEANMCGRSKEMADAADEMKKLGEGKPPAKTVNLSMKQDGYQLYIWGVSAAAAAGIVLVLYRKRKKA